MKFISSRKKKMKETIFEIERIPNEIRIELPKPGEMYPKLILELPISVKRNFLILGCEKAKIILQRERNDERFEIFATLYEKKIHPSYKYIRFYAELTPKLYDEIESFRAGGNLSVYLDVNRLYLLPYETYDIFRQVRENSPTSILQGKYLQDVVIISYNAYTRDRLLITREQWNEKVLKPLGMGERFIFEIPCKFDDITIDIEHSEINELKNRLTQGVNVLRKAIDEYSTGKDVDKCVDNVRRATDLLHNIPNRDNLFRLYGEYLIKKSSTGSDNISEELISDVFRIIDLLFNISSKGPHETTRKGIRMEYYPKNEDAEMLSGVVSLIYSWMLKKFERWLAIEQK